MRPQVYFTRHPRYINEKALELAESLLIENIRGSKVPCKTVEEVAKALCTAALAEPMFCRTAVLIARSTAAELFWTDKQLSTALQEELVDLVTSNFISAWTNEFNRGCNPEHDGHLCPTLDDLALQLEDSRFKQSNPRLEESTFEDLYLEELDIADCQGVISLNLPPAVEIPGPSIEPDRTPTQPKARLPPIEEARHEETVCLASILLGDLYSMGFIHLDVMQTCILYIVDNICLASDVRCLHILLNRGATYLAPSLGLVFLRMCHYKIMLAGSAMLKNNANEVVELLTLIDEIIANDVMFQTNSNVACYAQRGCHRWDSTLGGKLSLQP